jgi:hypothetical protein
VIVLLRALFADRGGSAARFVGACEDAASAIDRLPCAGCGAVQWPVIRKPEWGSAEWWDDPSPQFKCRNCGRCLGDAWPRVPNEHYPFDPPAARRGIPS